MRKTFAEIAVARDVKLDSAYRTLWTMFNESFGDENGLGVGRSATPYTLRLTSSFAQLCEWNFKQLPTTFRRYHQTFAEYNYAKGCEFAYGLGETIDIDQLLTYIEYTCTMIRQLGLAGKLGGYEFATVPFFKFIDLLLEDLGHVRKEKDGLVFVVPKSNPVLMAAQTLPNDLGYKTYRYIHRETTGDIGTKRDVLKSLGDYLEPKRKQLEALHRDASDRIFSMLNNANIRHNNVAKGDKNYRRVIAEMSENDLEKLYDDVFELCIIACLLLDSVSALANIKNVESQF